MKNKKQVIKTVGLFCGLIISTLSAWSQATYNVLDFGAKRDSMSLNTKVIDQVIKEASANGGGTIYFPAGKYLTGPIHLVSNIRLYLDAGAELHFSDRFDDYLPMVPSRWEGIDVTNFSPLIYAYEAENITIEGCGLINGHGQKWWEYYASKRDSEHSPWEKEFKRLNKDILHPDEPGWVEIGFLRPPFIQPMYCKNVRIAGITIVNSPFWTVNPEFCDNVTVDGVTIRNPHSPNTDGINPESCSNVHIANCHISVGDDCITIKSGKDRAGRKMARPAENYTITNCTMLAGHGGVGIGSEVSGGVKKITISNCVFDGTDRGIRIKTARGRGGVVEDIRVSNIVMKNIHDQAIVLDMQYAKTKPEPISERTPAFRNIHLSGITAQGNQAGYLNGLEEMPIEQVSFNDMVMNMESGFELKNAQGISFNNVLVNLTQGPAIKASSVKNIVINGLRTEKMDGIAPVLKFDAVQQGFITNSFVMEPIAQFLQVSGTSSVNIVAKGNYLMQVKTPLSKGVEVKNNIIVE